MMLIQAAATAPVASGASTFIGSVAAAFALLLSGIPRLIAFLLILAAGWIVAALLAKAVAGLMHTAKFARLADRAGISRFIARMGTREDAADVGAGVVRWIVRIVALIMAFDALGIHAVSGILQSLLLWLPNLAVAIVALVLGGIAARAVGSLVRGAASEARIGNAATLSTIAQGAIMAFAVIIALNQIGVAQIVVNTLFIGTVGACALAIGIAFGLGGQQRASRLVEGWGEQLANARPKLAAGRRVSGAGAPATGKHTGFAGVGGRPDFVERTATDRRAGDDRRQLVVAS